MARSLVLAGFTITYGSIMRALAVCVGIAVSRAVGRPMEERLTPLPGVHASGHL